MVLWIGSYAYRPEHFILRIPNPKSVHYDKCLAVLFNFDFNYAQMVRM